MSEEESLLKADDSDTDYTIDPIENNDKSIAYGLYTKIESYQSHYNIVKTKYKLLGSTWLLATFIGIGYLLAGKEMGLPISELSAISLLCLLSSAGLSLIYFLDISVYHRLLEALYRGALELENKNPFLARTNNSMKPILFKGNAGPEVLDGLFYAYFIFILLLISDIAFFTQYNSKNPLLITILSIIFLVVSVSISLFVVLKARESGFLRLFKSHKNKIK